VGVEEPTMADSIDTDKPASEQFDLTTETNDEILDPEKLHEVAHELEKIPDADLSCHSSDFLAEHVEALKRLEDAVEDARKKGYEAELKPRVDDGEQVGNLQKRSGSNTFVADAEAAFAAVAEAGGDPLDVASVKVGALRDVLGASADEYLGSSEYTFFARQ
jgi:hypothetical protein